MRFRTVCFKFWLWCREELFVPGVGCWCEPWFGSRQYSDICRGLWPVEYKELKEMGSTGSSPNVPDGAIYSTRMVEFD